MNVHGDPRVGAAARAMGPKAQSPASTHEQSAFENMREEQPTRPTVFNRGLDSKRELGSPLGLRTAGIFDPSSSRACGWP